VINNKDENPLRIYETRYRLLNPTEAAARTGTTFEAAHGRFLLTLLGTPVFASFPEYSLLNADGCLGGASARLLILRYLLEGHDAPGNGAFLPYRALPWGEVYNANFQGRCIKRLAFTFSSRIPAFSQACLSLGGKQISGADAAFELSFLDKHRVRLLLWSGDDEFPPSSQILFSDDCALAFTAEDLAAAGDLIISRLKERV